MFKKLFKKKTNINKDIQRTIKEPEKEDNFSRIKMVSKEVYDTLSKALKTEKGVHPQSLMCAIGALAGYACQEAIREVYRTEGVPTDQVFRIIETQDGSRYLHNNDLDKPLAMDQYSVWAFIGGAAQSQGCTDLPSINELFTYVVGMLGDEDYGKIRVSEADQPRAKTFQYLTDFWEIVFPIVKKHCSNPVEWPMVFAFAGQTIIDKTATRINPKIATTIIMESAIFMSKVELKRDDKIPIKKSDKETVTENDLKRATYATDTIEFPIYTVVAGKLVYENLLNILNSERGVHIESFMCAVGSLAGYACQEAVRTLSESGEIEGRAFDIVETENGSRYFYGDHLNGLLAEDYNSVGTVIGKAARDNGCTELPDLHEYFAYVTSVVGSDGYGVLRVPKNHQPHNKPLEYLMALWPRIQPVVKKTNPNPTQWPMAYAYAAQQMMKEGKDHIAPEVAFALIMESAVFMSKIELMDS